MKTLAPWRTLVMIAAIMMALGWILVSFRYGLLIGPGWLGLLTICAFAIKPFTKAGPP